MLGDVMTLSELEITRRSAAMAPLSPGAVAQLLEEMHRLLVEREKITAIVGDLPPTMGSLRDSLNELHRVLSAV
jgi:predicted component of type VI protein secretion system